MKVVHSCKYIKHIIAHTTEVVILLYYLVIYIISKMKQIDKIIWIILLIIIFTAVINSIGNIFDIKFLQVDTNKNLLILLPVLLLVIHAVRTLNIFRATLFIFITSFTGFVFEFYGLKYGTLFGGHYIYAVETLKFMTVPINVILYWAVFIYT